MTGTADRPPRLCRSADGRVLAGVAAGLAQHLGLSITVVRIAFVVLAVTGGMGLALYGAFWVLVPQDTSEASFGAAARRPRDVASLVALASLAAGGLLLLQMLGVGVGTGLGWPLLLAGFGVVLLWRQADDQARERWRFLTVRGGSRWPALLRLLFGVVLVLTGALLFLAGRGSIRELGPSLAAGAVVALGIGLISGPFWVRMWRELGDERAERIRATERAEVSAHVHDSVLHTLALIQRHIDDPRTVQRLARAQERELRGWLYQGEADADERFAAAVERLAAEVEDAHGVTVETVVVGDRPLDAALGAQLAATREALVNAAKYAADSAISLYAEVEGGKVTVFVRDRGPGFDLAQVPEDRLGVRQSIIGRMQRNGGLAVIRSDSALGTEVRLEMDAEVSRA